MKDLTHGPLGRLLAAMALPIGAGMLLQTLYYLVDLWFVTKLGEAAIAGVSAGGNVFFVVLGLTQMMGVGTVALVSHAVGRKDRAAANLAFNQAVAMAAALTIATLAGGYALAGPYMRALGADAATQAAGIAFLHAFIPGLAAQFPMVVMGSALRGTGIVKPGMVVQAFTVLLNAALAPVLIAGWGTGVPLGVAGAGLATSIAAVTGVILMAAYFVRLEKYVGFDAPLLAPRAAVWGRLVNIGLPAGGEFFLIAVFTATVYGIIRDFGAAAQAGYGLGGRLIQALFLPALAIAFAAAPLAGQNYGAGNFARVRGTFRVAVLANFTLMSGLTLLCQWQGGRLIGAFSPDEAVVRFGTEFLGIISWNFVATGITLSCSSLFQAMGNTWPSLLAAATRLVTFVGPAVWLSRQPDFQLPWVWRLAVATVLLQAGMSLLLLRQQFRTRLS